MKREAASLAFLKDFKLTEVHGDGKNNQIIFNVKYL